MPTPPVIDAHIHLIKPFDSAGRPQRYSVRRSDGAANPTSAEDFIALMDASGIDHAFFISWSPEDIPSDLSRKGVDPATVRETMSPAYALDVMRRCGERFYWFPCHLGPAVPDHMAQARRHLEAGATGLKLVTSFWGELPDDPRCRRIISLAAAFEAPVIIDTSFWYLGIDEPAPLETIAPGHRQVAPRVRDWNDYAGHLRRTFESFPSINFELAHAGARTFTPEHAAESGALIREYPHVYADLGALDPGAPALEALVEAAGPDRVMFGTDWPHFAQGADMADRIAAVRAPGRFSAETAGRILGGNARDFVKGRRPGLIPRG